MRDLRKVDALVAQRVLRLGKYEHLQNSEGRTVNHIIWVDSQTWIPLPHFSSDIKCAWEVVDRLVAEGLQLKISAYKDGAHVDFGTPRTGTWTPRRVAASTVPLAICLAALRDRSIDVSEWTRSE